MDIPLQGNTDSDDITSTSQSQPDHAGEHNRESSHDSGRDNDQDSGPNIRQAPPSGIGTGRTRSGRIIKPPDRYGS